MHDTLLRCAGLFLILLSTPVAAQPAGTTLHYAAYIRGLNAFDLDATVAIAPRSYRMQVGFRLTGTVGALFHAESVSTVDGAFQGNTPAPRSLVSAGRFRGKAHAMQIDWQGGIPVITRMDPPDEDKREPVPAADQAHTMDALSAIVALMHRVQTTGRCEGALRIYDGRRLSEFAARTVGEETLEETSRSSFKGTALRCDVEGRMLAGFATDADRAALSRLQHGSAWFARIAPGEPPMPVRITFDARTFGEATMYLTGDAPN